jgi:hypothetical protein
MSSLVSGKTEHKNVLILEILINIATRMCRIKHKSTHKNVLLSMLNCDVFMGLYNLYVYDLLQKSNGNGPFILFYKF